MHHPRQMSAAVLLAADAHSAEARMPAPLPARIERIEPAFWRVGMHRDKLQLMVHGPHIGDAQPQVADASARSVRIDSVSRAANPDDLFIDLRCSRARPGPPGGAASIRRT